MGLGYARWAGVITAVAITLCGSGTGIEARQTVQASWADQDIGNPAIAGSASSTPTGFTITAGGTNIGGTSDQFHFVYQQITGDVEVRARLDSLAYTSTWAKAGAMIRDSLGPDAAYGFVLESGGQGTWFQRRGLAGGTSARTGGVVVDPPVWLRLVRRGDTFSGYTSPNGANWTLITSKTIQLGATAYVGLAVSSHRASVATTASFSQVSVTSLALPAGQQNADIGAPAIAGSATYANGTYQIHAGGTDIGGTADQFHYVYQQVSGDVDVSLHVASVSPADSSSRAGIMIRESLSAGAAHGSAFLAAGNGYSLQRRPVTGGTSLGTAGSPSTPPGWVRLTRSGFLLTAYQSSDGNTWTPIGSDSVPMADTVYVGIAVTSRNATTATDVTADSLVVTQTAPADLPPVVSISSPADGASFTAPATITITANASDPENQLAKVDFYN